MYCFNVFGPRKTLQKQGVPNSKELVFFELLLITSSLGEMTTGVYGKENVECVVVQSEGQPGV
jgi:hypothetical protein